MTIIEAMGKTIKQAKTTDNLCYLYLRDSNYRVSSNYEKDWLFQAYPGGRKILSSEGNRMVQEALGK